MATVKPWKTKEAKAIAEEAGLKALRAGMEHILTEAIDMTPVQSGTLRRSGTVTVGGLPDPDHVYAQAAAGTDMSNAFPGLKGVKKIAYISFNTPYARRQHEGIGYYHPLGGTAKYLETPFNQNKAKVLKYVDAMIKKALAKG